MKSEAEAIEIRRIYAENGGNISDCARQIGCTRATIRRALRRDYSRNGGKTHRVHAHPEDARIEQILVDNAPAEKRSKKLRLTATRIARIMRAEGCALSERQLLKRVAIVRERLDTQPHKAVYAELSAPPGAFQVDYGQYECTLGGDLVTVHALIVSSAYSNAFAAVACVSEDAACFFGGLESCFKQLGGVPPVLRFDNLAPAVCWQVGKRCITEGFSRFAAHYGFCPEFCNPRSGWEKGNVENKVRYLRNNFFNPPALCVYANLTRLNDALSDFCEKDRLRQHYKKKAQICALFNEERGALFPLGRPFGYRDRIEAHVDGCGYAIYKGNRYFTRALNPPRHVIIEAAAEEIGIYDAAGRLIARHPRALGKGRRVQSIEDTAAVLARKPGAISYVLDLGDEAAAIQARIKALPSSARKAPLMEILTARADVQKETSHYAPDLAKYDMLAGIQADGGRYSEIVHTAQTGAGNTGNGRRSG